MHPERGVQLIDYFHLPPVYLTRPFECRGICNEFSQQQIIQPLNSCPGDIYMLFLVISSHSNRDRRNAIRQTWGSVSHTKNRSIRVIFVLGMPPFTNPITAYKPENQRYKDLLVFNVTDSYFALTNKTALAFQWISKFCANVRFIMKTDDDSFNVPWAVVDLVERFSSQRDVLLGQCASGIRPYRDPRNKWYVSELDYPDQFLTLYLRGRGYVLTFSAMSKLLLASKFVRFNTMEDVFWTGFCRLRASLQTTCSSGFAITDEGIMAEMCQVMSHDLINIHHVTKSEMFTYWSWINDKTRSDSCQNTN